MGGLMSFLSRISNFTALKNTIMGYGVSFDDDRDQAISVTHRVNYIGVFIAFLFMAFLFFVLVWWPAPSFTAAGFAEWAQNITMIPDQFWYVVDAIIVVVLSGSLIRNKVVNARSSAPAPMAIGPEPVAVPVDNGDPNIAPLTPEPDSSITKVSTEEQNIVPDLPTPPSEDNSVLLANDDEDDEFFQSIDPMKAHK